eukprot:m.144392 g.144392  ORF g.144392 m.144392 type:complete len:94 (-) comp14920_c0_seq2:11-292(-)
MSRFSLILTILLVAVVDKVSTTATVEDCYNFANYYNKTLEPIFLRNYSSCGPRQQCVCIQNCMSCNNSGMYISYNINNNNTHKQRRQRQRQRC